MQYTVLLTPRAIRELDQAVEYIRKASPAAAERWEQSCYATIKQLGDDPRIWPVAPESANSVVKARHVLFRTKSRQSNRIIYIIEGDEVHVLAILRPGQPLVDLDEFDG